MKPKLGLDMRPAETQEVQLICNCCGQPYHPDKSWEDRLRAVILGAEDDLRNVTARGDRSNAQVQSEFLKRTPSATGIFGVQTDHCPDQKHEQTRN